VAKCGRLSLFSLFIKTEWLTVSNAVRNSMRKQRTYLLFSSSLVTWWKQNVSAVTVLPVGRKANWSQMSDGLMDCRNQRLTISLLVDWLWEWQIWVGNHWWFYIYFEYLFYEYLFNIYLKYLCPLHKSTYRDLSGVIQLNIHGRRTPG